MFRLLWLIGALLTMPQIPLRSVVIFDVAVPLVWALLC